MIHPTDDELLELALSEDDSDAEVQEHLKGCPGCASRFEEVRAEQELLKGAFAEVDPPARFQPRPIPSRRLRPWAAAAALLLCLGIGVGAGATRAMAWKRQAEESVALRARIKDLENRPLPPSFGLVQQKLKTVTHDIAGRREALRDGREEASKEFLESVQRGEGIFVAGLEEAIDRAGRLDARQRAALRRVVDDFSDRAISERDRGKVRKEYLAAIRDVLTGEQYDAFVEFSRCAGEAEWNDDIDALTEALAKVLDLRFSEAERVRDVLESKYPREMLPGIDLELSPSDPLIDDSALRAGIRDALKPEYRGRFDAWIRDAARGREEAERVVRTRSPGE